jgi:hypothetical protein
MCAWSNWTRIRRSGRLGLGIRGNIPGICVVSLARMALSPRMDVSPVKMVYYGASSGIGCESSAAKVGTFSL